MTHARHRPPHQCLPWRLKRSARSCKHELLQFKAPSYLVENNRLKSGVYEHQISSSEAIAPSIAYFLVFSNWTAVGWRSGDLTTEWYQWCAPCCKSSVFIVMQACLDWSFDNDTVLSGANTNSTLSRCSWAHKERLSEGLEESEGF